MAIRAFLTGVALEAPEVLKGVMEVVLVGAAATADVVVELPVEASVPVLALATVDFAEATSPETVTFSQSAIY